MAQLHLRLTPLLSLCCGGPEAGLTPQSRLQKHGEENAGSQEAGLGADCSEVQSSRPWVWSAHAESASDGFKKQSTLQPAC